MRRAGLLLLVLLSTVTCTNRSPSEPRLQDSANIISDRPIAESSEVYVVTLRAPALLNVRQHVGTGWVIPEEKKRELLQEQENFVQRLAELSKEIHVVYRYRLTLNGMAVFAPTSLQPELEKLAGVKSVERARVFAKPQQLNTSPPEGPIQEVTSVSFIGAEEAYRQGFKGQGMSVGVLDTGIDYTHKMLGGRGVKEEFKSINPDQPSSAFPNAKVVGGVDLAGTSFNAASPIAAERLPKPDSNPIDEAGHGTHVAATVAGIGDGRNTYSGVAPEAQIHAIKVFGKTGSTMDAVVIAGFEYAADPNGDLDTNDQLDVINLSLGGGFGQPQILYSEAVRTLTKAGTVVVASAGNSGPIEHIVGAPSTANDAISVAASIDGSPHNWQFAAVRFIAPSNSHWMAKATEGPVSKPLEEAGPVSGELFHIGLADTELSEEVKAQLKGKVALIVRGKVPFFEKLKRAAEAGAIGAVVYNNEAGKPIPMGGEGKVEIPAIMVSQALGLRLLDELKLGAVRIDFQTGEKIEEPELVDTVTDFSSKGPRSEDNLLKPEIAAPGQRVISAAMGEGAGAVQMDGTSMAAPHMAGVMALLKQARPQLRPAELKALAMNTAKVMVFKKEMIPISQQGAGRVQIAEALRSPVLVLEGGLSLGRVQLGGVLQQSRELTLKNITGNDVELDVRSQSQPGLTLITSPRVRLPAGAEVRVPVTVQFNLTEPQKFASELNGRIFFERDGVTLAQVPALAIRTQSSDIEASSAAGSLQLKNRSAITGLALAFNLLGQDERKAEPLPHQSWKSRSCDLQAAGYRILTKRSASQQKEFLQFAFKLHTPVTTWHLCELSVLVDTDGDDIAEQELAGISASSVAGVSDSAFASILLDAAQARAIRLEYEKNLAEGKEGAPDYKPAILSSSGMAPFTHASVAIIEAPLDKVARHKDGGFRIKVAALGTAGDTVESDDFLGKNLGEWKTIGATKESHPYSDFPEFTPVTPQGKELQLKQNSKGELLMLYPFNPTNLTSPDTQSQILELNQEPKPSPPMP